jgi:hypothetical protein
MINAQVKVIENGNTEFFRSLMNEFLKTIDVRQIVKTEYSTSIYGNSFKFSAMIYYVGIEDIRDAKIDNILEIK